MFSYRFSDSDVLLIRLGQEFSAIELVVAMQIWFGRVWFVQGLKYD